MQSPTLTLDDTVIPTEPIAVVSSGAGPGQATYLEAESELEIPPADDPTNFWDHSQTAGSQLNDGHKSMFVQDVFVTKKASTSTSTLVLGGFILVIAGGFFWNFAVNHESPKQTLTQLYHFLTGTQADVPVVVANKVPKRPSIKLAEVPAPAVLVHATTQVGQTFENPYLRLKNELSEKPPRRTAILHAKEENQWRTGLENPFYYQRYKTVLDIVAARKYGSEAILRDALKTGKFWMRMQAVIGLADMGYEIKKEDIKMALGDAHRELRSRYFARLEQGPCGVGCLLIARGALSELDSTGRLQILKVIAKDHSMMTADHMVAASFDREKAVRDFAIEWLLRNPVEESDWWRVFDIIATEPPLEQNLNTNHNSVGLTAQG